MVKLVKILNEVLNTFIIECEILTDKKFNITDVLDEIRALRKVTIVRNITPEDYIQKPNIEYHLITIKFITRGNAKQDLVKMKQDILTSDRSKNDLRIPGAKSIKFKEETLKRL